VDSYQEIKYEVAERIATISLNRPQARNSYTLLMADELADAFDRADSDDAVRVVIYTGEGEHFCSGLDLTISELDNPAESAEDWAEPAGRCSMRRRSPPGWYPGV
jgi:enoyl-CoA hydratase/carnithine racemase